MSVHAFTDWIASTPPSQLIQHNEVWAIPAIQTIHIAGIGVVLACVLMMTLRIFGYAGRDQSLAQTERRFGPWLRGALWLLLATGGLLIIGEPERELITFSFWAKMVLVALGAGIAFAFHWTLKTHGPDWEESLAQRARLKVVAVGSLLIWIAIVFLGRLIAYDHVWGALSPATRS